MHSNTPVRRAAAVALCVILFWPLQAMSDEVDPRVEPGVEERDLERLDPDRFRPRPELDLQIPQDPPMEEVADVEFDIDRFNFEGNTVLDDSQLAELIDDYRGTIAFRDLLEATNVITDAYRDAGYIVARAYVPEQVVDDGEVRISVLEGMVGDIHLDGESPIGPERTVRRLDQLVQTGLINARDLERGALLLNDLPGMDAGVNLRPGEQPGSTDVVVEPRNVRWWDLSVDYNNFGAEVTGEHRFGLQGQINNLFNIGDRIYLRPIVSDTGDTYYGALGFDAPVFTPATRLGLRYSHLQSDIVEEFEDLEIENTATTITAHAEHAFIRSRDRNLNARFAYEHRNFERELFFDFAPDEPIEEADYTLDILELGASGDYRDDWLGGGMSNGYVALRAGLSEVDAEDGGATTPGEERFDGEFFSLQFGGQRVQRLMPLTSLSVRLDGQYSSDNLDSSERISLGGPNGVRSYRTSEALGDSGTVLQTELRREIPYLSERAAWVTRVEGYALLDAGYSERNEVDGESKRDSHSRSSYGAGLRVRGADEYYIDLAVATRLARKESLVDQPDDDDTRFWAQAVYWF